MATSDKNWVTVARSKFPWEQEALDFIYERFPAQDNYRAWANFEFIADDGSINEVDLLVACPNGVFLIEIKSKPGTVSGDAMNWTWNDAGQRHTIENPLLLANRKCKRLKSLLCRQRAFSKEAQPFIEPLIFLSHRDIVCHLTGTEEFKVCLRDIDNGEKRSGIIAAIRRRECPGLKAFDQPAINRPVIRAVAQAMEQAGIRPAQASRRVGDFELQSLLFDSPTGACQDWLAHHATQKKTIRQARIYMVARQTTPEQRDIIKQAAKREFLILEHLDHPGIAKADPPTECEHGPVLFLRRDPDAKPLDHFLRDEADTLTVYQRLDLIRQIAEVMRYAHGKKVIHRSLSPDSILVGRDQTDRPLVQVFNWHTGARLPGSSTIGTTRISSTLHASQLIEDGSLVYLAPEAIAGNADGWTEMDIFSLGALTYLIFTGKPPADSITALQDKLRTSVSGGLNIREALDGASDALADLVLNSATSQASDRYTAEEFLAGLERLEDELTRPEEPEWVDPRNANKGDRLTDDFTVEKRLGSGAVSMVYQVRKGDHSCVLKVARDPNYNQRIQDEYALLKSIAEIPVREVVRPFDWLIFDEVTGFTMESAGEESSHREHIDKPGVRQRPDRRLPDRVSVHDNPQTPLGNRQKTDSRHGTKRVPSLRRLRKSTEVQRMPAL